MFGYFSPPKMAHFFPLRELKLSKLYNLGPHIWKQFKWLHQLMNALIVSKDPELVRHTIIHFLILISSHNVAYDSLRLLVYYTVRDICFLAILVCVMVFKQMFSHLVLCYYCSGKFLFVALKTDNIHVMHCQIKSEGSLWLRAVVPNLFSLKPPYFLNLINLL